MPSLYFITKTRLKNCCDRCSKLHSWFLAVCFLSMLIATSVLNFKSTNIFYLQEIGNKTTIPIKNNNKTFYERNQPFSNRTYSSQCSMFQSFDISKAIMSGAVLQNKSIKQLSEFYSTPESILELARKVSLQFGVNDLPVPKPGASCVVVGSGGILLQYPNLGKVIDSYDYVIRVNLSPTKNFEKYVGTRTSLNFTYWRSLLIGSQTGRAVNKTHIVYGGMFTSEFRNLLSLLKSDKESTLTAMYRSSKLTFSSLYSLKWIQETFWKAEKTRRRPSTGLQVFLISSHWCPTPPDFAGFGFIFNKTVPYHYFDKSRLYTNVHNPENEVALVRTFKNCQLIGKDLTHSLG